MQPQDIATARRDLWQATVNQELQELIKQAAAYRSEIDKSKTGVKRRYFQRKMESVTTDVMRMLTALETIKRHDARVAEADGATNTASQGSTDV